MVHSLTIQVEWKEVLQDISMQFELGKNYCILGRNGSGKSSLAMSIMGHPKYELVTHGEDWKAHILLHQESDYIDDTTKTILSEKGIDNLNKIALDDLEPNIKAKLGIFVAFQNIPEIKGVKLFEFLRTIYNTKRWTNETFLSFKKVIEPLCAELAIERDFLRRDVNVGFSGWERRKIELLQLILLKPRYVFLDEIDSGLDVDAFKSVVRLLWDYNSSENTLIIITHYFHILDQLPVDHVYLLDGWRLIGEWDIGMARQVQEHGFESLDFQKDFENT